ncbi:hypothetical protein BDP27DRAFT_1312290 [Rhodocollybia butyracea]|uniref:Uncharacterized protein n=1 Tax=Rhodocollybia butyracea TaxID=206335 RepID=A0A9P5UFK4_9AGAR|nr:hypothetical protein BDP27DRAFT_1312290 [Rhodocollybia butyracea]
MPLFGHKSDKKHNTLRKDERASTTGTGAPGMTSGAPMPGSGVAAADSNYPPTGGRMNEQDFANQPMSNEVRSLWHGHGRGIGNMDGYNNDGYGQGMPNNQGNIPSSWSNANAPGGQHGHTSATGKVETAIGSVVGSNALKAKGMQKEMEANALKTQSTELAEAERLEKEAMLRRERAVANGAHPHNRHLGGTGGTGGSGGMLN